MEKISAIIKESTLASGQVTAAAQEQLSMVENMVVHAGQLAQTAEKLNKEVSQFTV